MTDNDMHIFVVDNGFAHEADAFDIAAFIRGHFSVVDLLPSVEHALDCVNELPCVDNSSRLFVIGINELDTAHRAFFESIRATQAYYPVLAFVRNLNDDLYRDLASLGCTEIVPQPVISSELILQSVSRACELGQLRMENSQCYIRLEHVDRKLDEHLKALEQDQQAAKQIQTNLLPLSPKSLGRVQARHQISPSLYLSGDFIDYGLVCGCFVPFYLTDVSGHGASSAFVTVWLKQMIRQYFESSAVFRRSKDLPNDLSDLLSEINKQLMRSRFFCHLTACFGVIDLRNNTLHYILAGHLPMPVLLVDGQAQFLQGKGKPIGIFDEVQWQVVSTRLPESYTLLVFSDGILEVFPQSELSSKEKYLLDIVSQTEGDIERINTALELGSVDTIPDDIAMLSLTCVGGT